VLLRVGPLLGRLVGHLHHLGIALHLRIGSLGFLDADVLLVARQVIALFLRDVVVGIRLGLHHVATRLRGVLVVRLEFGLRNLLLALGFLLADVLRIAGHARAVVLVGLVLRFDLVLVRLV